MRSVSHVFLALVAVVVVAAPLPLASSDSSSDGTQTPPITLSVRSATARLVEDDSVIISGNGMCDTSTMTGPVAGIDASIFPPGATGCGQQALVTNTDTGASVTYNLACTKCASNSTIQLAANTFPDVQGTDSMPINITFIQLPSFVPAYSFDT